MHNSMRIRKTGCQVQNPVERINEGLQVLIDSIYNKLGYITHFIDSTKELYDLLFSEDLQIKMFAGDEDVPNKLALEELAQYIERNTKRHIPVTMKTILEQYSQSPYGWLDDDIRALVIRLFKA